MPQCQFLFSAVFDSRKFTKEIFSESTKEVILRSFIPKESRIQKGAPGGGDLVGPHHPQARPSLAGRARAWCGPPEHLPGPPFRLLIPPGLKTLNIVAISRKEVRSRRHREKPSSGGESSVPGPWQNGEVAPERFPSAPPATSTPFFAP